MLRAVLSPVFLFFALPGLANEPVPTWKEPIKRVQAMIPEGLPQRLPPLPAFPSVWPGRSEAEQEENPVVNSALPGMGTLAPSGAASTGPSSQGRNFLGGSLELTASIQHHTQPKAVPAIYVEGEGYLPITHPAIEPYLLPEVLKNPASDPSVVMVLESDLANSLAVADAGLAVGRAAARPVNISGNTLLSLPRQDHFEPIVISATSGWKRQTESHEIHYLSGDCSIRQADSLAQGPRAVVWVERHKNRDTQTREVTAYFESDGTASPVYVEFAPGVPETVETKVFDQKWLGRFTTRSSIDIAVMNSEIAPEQEPAIHQRALSALSPEQAVIDQGQLTKTSTSTAPTAAPRYRRIIINPRRDNDFDYALDPLPNDPNRGVLVITKGINVDVQDELLLGKIVDISADNAVIWMANPSRFVNNREQVEDRNQDFEVYLEGNIRFLDGPRIIEAHRMYYDAKNNLAYILEGRLETPILGIKGITGHLRLKAEVLQQMGEGIFTAKNSLVTTSRLGEPTYSLRSRTMTMTEKVSVPAFGSQEPVTRQILVGENNYLAARNIPVFYWPWMAADLKDPTFYLKSIAYGNNDIYGNRLGPVPIA